jgi:hypothetical protein
MLLLQRKKLNDPLHVAASVKSFPTSLLDCRSIKDIIEVFKSWDLF